MLDRIYKFVLLGIIVCVAKQAKADRLDISRLTQDGEFSATFGTAYKTGLDSKKTHQMNFNSGRINELGLDLAYSPTENLTFDFSTSNNYSDSQVGIQYKLVKNNVFKMDFVADYGIAWTKNEDTHKRYGNNNVDYGFKFSGHTRRRLQWAVSLLAQFVWAEPANFWNINTTWQLMYYLYDDLATNLQFDFSVLEIRQPKTRYDKSLKYSFVYNFTKKTAVKPFVKYHFKTQDFRNTFVSFYDWMEIGLSVSAQF